MALTPDTKDWTWVLDRPCPDCGYDASAVRPFEIPEAITAHSGGWRVALADPAAGVRPAPEVWSPLEYACHIRDVHRVFDGRVRLMLEQDDPLFENWDQDQAALDGRYAEQDPAVVADELVQAAAEVAARYAAVGGDQWQRSGRRSNGSVFTVASLGRYHLHDLVHHGRDVELA